MHAEREKGFALIGALMVAILFFIIVSVLMTDLIRVTRSSATGRSRLVAESLAESGAELAARHMLLGLQSNFSQELPEGSFTAKWQRFPTNLPNIWRFTIVVDARSRTVPPHESSLVIEGTYQAGRLDIRRTEHSTMTAASTTSGGEGGTSTSAPGLQTRP